jgi:sulfatase modifying factor 1
VRAPRRALRGRLAGYTLFIAAAATGCNETAAPLPQWRVVLGTDAPIPQLGDRLLIEILDDDGLACSGCRRQLSAEDPAAWPLSFGVVPPAEGGVRVRARLYRTAVTGYDGSPGSNRVIDALVRLPEPDGVTEVSIPLRMSCFGVPSSLDTESTCDPETGAPGPVPTAGQAPLPSPGTWAPALPVDCPGPVDAGMVCIPGGAFLMGSPDYLPLGDLDPVPEQLVQISPFTLDADEMTVGAIRALVPTVGAPADSGDNPSCTYTPQPSADGSSEQLPVNCVTLAQARSACEALGKRLPTEAEWEWAAGNLGRETRYPWGSGPPCSFAAVALGFVLDETTSTQCLGPGDSSGAVPVGTTADVTDLGVRDLGGNLTEWIEGDFQPYTDPTCWGQETRLLVNPVCKSGGQPALRGGSWLKLAVLAQVSLRNANINTQANRGIGFRCAK